MYALLRKTSCALVSKLTASGVGGVTVTKWRHASVLVLNSGSSSIKFQVVDNIRGKVLLQGQAENLNTSQGKLKWQEGADGQTLKTTLPNPQFEGVVDKVFDLVQPHSFSLIGHRIVHGGERFTKPTKLNQDVAEELASLSKLAPLHNPLQLRLIKMALKRFPQAGQGAVFDTAFYATLPPHAFMYAVPHAWYTQHGVRKYGFHGTSHYYLGQEAARRLNKDDLRLVSCHLGAGCSVTASIGGVAVDTSMGFSPLSGLMMATRTGDIDPTAIQHIVEETGRSFKDVLADLNQQGGLKGIAGTPDSLQVENLYLQKEEKGVLAVEMFCYNVAKYIASYAVPLGRIEALVFSAGIGEKSAIKRELILKHLSGLGFTCHTEANARHGAGRQGLVSVEGQGPPVLVVPANEELVIANLTQQLFS